MYRETFKLFFIGCVIQTLWVSGESSCNLQVYKGIRTNLLSWGCLYICHCIHKHISACFFASSKYLKGRKWMKFNQRSTRLKSLSVGIILVRELFKTFASREIASKHEIPLLRPWGRARRTRSTAALDKRSRSPQKKALLPIFVLSLSDIKRVYCCVWRI